MESILAENNRKIEEAQKKLVSKNVTCRVIAKANGTLVLCVCLQAEERLSIIEEQRKMDEERQRMRKDQEKRVKEEQKMILGKNNSRPKLSFSLK